MNETIKDDANSTEVEISCVKSNNNRVPFVVLTLAFLISVIFGIKSIDFGYHWDEPLQRDLIASAFERNTWLPSGFYNYPSATYWISLGSLLVVSPIGVITRAGFDQSSFFLIARSVFLTLSLAGVFFIYLAVRKFAAEWVAVSCALLYLASYQFFYHSRWIAPDAVLTMVFAVFIWVYCCAAESSRDRWSYLTYFVAAVAASTKWQGAVLLLPAVYLSLTRIDLRAKKFPKSLAFGLLTFVVTVLIITPGLVIEFHEVVRDIQFESNHYSTTHGSIFGVTPYDINNQIEYFSRMFDYVFLEMPSRYLIGSLSISIAAFFGVVILFKQNKKISIGLMMPVLVLIALLNSQVVFIVRNFLIFLPFILVFAGVALGNIRKDFVRNIFVALFLFISSFGLTSNLIEALEIGPNWEVVATEKIKSEITQHPDENYFLTAGARELLQSNGGNQIQNLVDCSSETVNVVMLASDLYGLKNPLKAWPANGNGDYKVFGQSEVDFDYYPTWAGNNRFIVISPEDQQRFGISCDSFKYE